MKVNKIPLTKTQKQAYQQIHHRLYRTLPLFHQQPLPWPKEVGEYFIVLLYIYIKFMCYLIHELYMAPDIAFHI